MKSIQWAIDGFCSKATYQGQQIDGCPKRLKWCIICENIWEWDIIYHRYKSKPLYHDEWYKCQADHNEICPKCKEK